jgi:DNA-binding transcriptional LysR family regulator
MRYPHISKLDLDLLYYLAVLLEERHVTKAAKRCFLSQSAMSRQLERLREALGDELLLRTGRSHERTARGERLLRELEPMLPRLEEILQGKGFEPAVSRDTFRVAMTDYACVVLLPEIVRRLTNAAPKASVEVLAWHENCLEDLRSGRMDTLITVAGLGVHPSVNCETIFADKFVCVVSARHPLNTQKVTLANSDMILTIPRRLAFPMARTAPVRLMAAPPEIKGFNYDMMWHPRLDDDPAHRWFREIIRGLGVDMMKSRLQRPHRLRDS